MGSPPDKGSKKQVLKCLSESSMVSAAAKTGIERTNKIEVINIDNANSGISNSFVVCM
jgi:hypothetical protein